MRFTVAILLISALAGCAGEVGNEARLAEAQSAYNTQDDNQCRAQGTTVGTDPYFTCRRALAQEHLDAQAAQQEQRRAAALAAGPQ
jgi:hypothetical protein